MIGSPFVKRAVDHPHVGDDAAVLVELGVEDQRPRRRVGLALGRRDSLDDRLEHLGHALAGLGGDPQRLGGIAAEQVGHLRGDPVRVGARQVHLVEHRDQLEAGVDRRVGVGDRLRLHALRGVDDQQRALAGGEAARHLVGEVDVPGRVDQVQVVGLAVGGLVVDPHGLGLDGDPALALEVHRVEHLRHVRARIDRAGQLEDAVGERRLAVIDVGDDREVADAVHGRTGRVGSTARDRMGAPADTSGSPSSCCPPRRSSSTGGSRLGETLVDIGCGTGNARCSQPSGERVNRNRSRRSGCWMWRPPQAEERGLDADLHARGGGLDAIPDAEAASSFSVFGVIFADRPSGRRAEIARVTGRADGSCSPPGSQGGSPSGSLQPRTMAESSDSRRPRHRSLARARVACRLVRAARVHAVAHRARLAFGAPSVDEFMRIEGENHPLAIAARPDARRGRPS